MVKHVALISSLDTILHTNNGQPFRYCDLYAGYAWNPLLSGGEWSRGIAKIQGHPQLKENQHTLLWSEWYLGRPQLLGGFYPGSAVVASDVCVLHSAPCSLFLWDTSPAATGDLVKMLGNRAAKVVNEEASVEDEEIRAAHFLFLDPPNGTESTWMRISGFIKHTRAPLLVWLPVSVDTTQRPPRENKQSERSRIEALEMHCLATKVRWSQGGRTVGCQLVYRLPSTSIAALRSSTSHVSRIMNWRIEHFGSNRSSG